LRFVDRLEPDPSAGRTGELPTGWVCADLVTESFPPTIVASSGQPPQAGPSDLYMVESIASGVDHRIGRIRTQSGMEPIVTDVAVGPGGALWAISFATLYRVDIQTGMAIEVGPLNVSTANALAFDAQGALYSATWDDGSLLRVDTITGAATRLGGFGSGFTSWGDLAFAPDGTLFAAVRSSLNDGVLVTVNPQTGAAARVGSIGVGDVFGLAFVGTALFGLTADLSTGTGALIRIDTSTGAGAVIRPLTFDAFGGGVRAWSPALPPVP
jgi:hypothetical protein